MPLSSSFFSGSAAGVSRHFQAPCSASLQVIRRPLPVACGGEDSTLVVLQNLQPVCDVRGVVGPRLRCVTEIGAKEGRAQLRTSSRRHHLRRQISFARSLGRTAQRTLQPGEYPQGSRAAGFPATLTGRPGATRRATRRAANREGSLRVRTILCDILISCRRLNRQHMTRCLIALSPPEVYVALILERIP
jgi:hypothetical protein